MGRRNLLKITTLAVISVGMSFCSSPKKKSTDEDTLQKKQTEYINPLIKQRADPWIYKDTDGTYYFIATAPEYDRIEIRKAKTINGLHDAEAAIVYRKNETGNIGNHLWAPELHKIDGKWYIHIAAAPAEKKWEIRMWVLSNESADPTQGEWKVEGQIKTVEDSFSLDATTFEHKGSHYLIWAQNIFGTQHGTALKMAKMATPTTLEGPEIVITRPDLAWERIGHNVNEGPAVTKHGDKIFVTYSASATDANYCLGLLWADSNADLMDSTSWHKSQEPVFFTNDSLKRFGPGHNSFSVAEDGKTDLLIYHARDFKEINGEPLHDPNRHTYVRPISWDENGFPDFGQNKAN